MRLLQVLALVAICALALPAQEYRGAIQGRVTDPTGSAGPPRRSPYRMWRRASR